eukprot:CAMPEP_0195574004 /NCGR_PEP_ID=MMETSP0814-20130614/5694_1 /TAXON_ID=97485 /ORGANISM="Prymnesium parvum, Strain Texoma1" /LENGTH=198 /DNA_ID=CAMNT_0040709955 /DNA_START=42 /DNA_END=640 /DNA_ORIENTATION=+
MTTTHSPARTSHHLRIHVRWLASQHFAQPVPHFGIAKSYPLAPQAAVGFHGLPGGLGCLLRRGRENVPLTSDGDTLRDEVPSLDGKIVLKVTNDKTCLKFQTDQASDIKRLDKLNNVFLTRMCGKDPNEETTEDAMLERPKSSDRDDPEKVNSSSKKSKKSDESKRMFNEPCSHRLDQPGAPNKCTLYVLDLDNRGEA